MRFSCYLYTVLIKTHLHLVHESSRSLNVCQAILSTVYLRRHIMSLHGKLREVIFGDNQQMKMVWIQQHGILASQKTCRICDSDMQFRAKSGVTEVFVWCCKRKGCKTTVSARDGSFIEKSKLLMDTWHFNRKRHGTTSRHAQNSS